MARSGDALLSEYEELRRAALGESNGPRQCVGFTLLLRKGMAAWMDACATATAASKSQPAPRLEHRLVPSDLRGEVALVIAAMALACPMEGGMTA
jgi:hypothetical protein